MIISEETLLASGVYFGSAGGQSTSKRLNNPGISPVSRVPSRVINHWEQEGILIERRQNGRGWRKIGLIEAIWVVDLANFPELS